MTLVAFAIAGEGAGAPLSFEGALRRALEVNNTIETARAEIEVAEAQKDQLLSAVMPRIDLNGSTTRNSIQQQFGEGEDRVTLLPRNDWNYSIILSQPVFAGRRELRAYSQAKLLVQNAREGGRGSEDAMLLQVASNYLAIVNADARIDIERRNIALAEKRREQADAFFQAGEVTRIDVLRADTAVKAAQRLVAATEQTRETAESDLRMALDLSGEIDVVPPARTMPSLPDEATLVRRAEESRPDVAVAQNLIRVADLEIAKQRGFWLPTVRFEGGMIHQKSGFPADRYSYGALRFNVPIFQSGEVFARVAVAREREKQAQLRYQDAKLSAREDVHKALVTLRSAETSLSLAREQLTAAEAEYEQAFELYRAQEATSLDVASSEQSLADARRAVSEETLNRDLAELRVWYAAGAIKEAVGVNNE